MKCNNDDYNREDRDDTGSMMDDSKRKDHEGEEEDSNDGSSMDVVVEGWKMIPI